MSESKKEQCYKKNHRMILASARKVFTDKGYQNASVNKIAEISKVTKRTLYKHFENKTHLYLTILFEEYRDFTNYILAQNINNQSGFSAMRALSLSYYKYFKSHYPTFKIMYNIGIIRQKTDNTLVEKIIKLDNATTKHIIEIIHLGQNDGSIVTSINAESIAEKMKFLLTSFFNQLTLTGKAYAKNINEPLDSFVEDTIDLLLKSLK